MLKALLLFLPCKRRKWHRAHPGDAGKSEAELGNRGFGGLLPGSGGCLRGHGQGRASGAAADGGFEPRQLPRLVYAPIDFQGHFDISTKGGGLRRRSKRAMIDFDRDGRLSVHGLPKCPVGRIENATPKEARQRLQGRDRRHRARRRDDRPAGGGADSGLLAADPVQGPARRQPDGRPPCPHHRPRVQTFAIVVPIERRHGAYAYRATIDVPPIAGGFGGSPTSTPRSAAATPSAATGAATLGPLLRRHPRNPRPLRLRRSTVISGAVQKPCTAPVGGSGFLYLPVAGR